MRSLARLIAGSTGGWIVGTLVTVMLASVGGAYVKGRSDGKTIESAYRDRLVAIEKSRIGEANAVAIAKANLRVTELIRERDKLAGEVADARAQAAVDPNADRTALGVESVRRLNRIK